MDRMMINISVVTRDLRIGVPLLELGTVVIGEVDETAVDVDRVVIVGLLAVLHLRVPLVPAKYLVVGHVGLTAELHVLVVLL